VESFFVSFTMSTMLLLHHYFYYDCRRYTGVEIHSVSFNVVWVLEFRNQVLCVCIRWLGFCSFDCVVKRQTNTRYSLVQSTQRVSSLQHIIDMGMKVFGGAGKWPYMS